jgi:hypothetical protein
MYLVYIIDQIHHLLNEHKKLIFAYNSDQREYFKKITMWDHEKILKPAVEGQLKETIGGPLKLRTILWAP